MNPMPLKVIWRKACLWAKNPSRLSKDLRPNKEIGVERNKGIYEGGEGKCTS
jgi:hypothetical protein